MLYLLMLMIIITTMMMMMVMMLVLMQMIRIIIMILITTTLSDKHRHTDVSQELHQTSVGVLFAFLVAPYHREELDRMVRHSILHCILHVTFELCT